MNMELVAESCRVGKKLGEPVDFRPNPIGSVHTPQVMGKVVNKSGVSNFVKANGTAGKLADVIIAQQDETVKVVMFNQVVDRWYDQFVKGRQCRISNGKLSNRKDDKYPNVSRQVILQLESIVDFLETPVLLAKVGASPPRPDNCKRPISVCNENSETFVSKKVKCLENEAWPGQTDDNESEYSLVGTQISKGTRNAHKLYRFRYALVIVC